jgi:hypothetical protein
MPLGLIVLVVLGFFWWWPLGLVLLLFFFGSRHMCWHRQAMSGYGGMGNPNGNGCYGGWQWSAGQPHWQGKMERMQAKMDRLREKMDGFGRGWGSPPSSGNRAFDDYRRDTLSRLEEEQKEFKEFLERLRFAKDREEFDQFMTERRNRPSNPPPQTPA